MYLRCKSKSINNVHPLGAEEKLLAICYLIRYSELSGDAR